MILDSGKLVLQYCNYKDSGKVLTTMLSWLQRMGAVEPYLALARAVSMLFTAMPRVRSWKGAGASESVACLESAL